MVDPRRRLAPAAAFEAPAQFIRPGGRNQRGAHADRETVPAPGQEGVGAPGPIPRQTVAERAADAAAPGRIGQ